MHPSLEVDPLDKREKMKRKASSKILSINNPLVKFDKSHMYPSIEGEPPKVQWEKKISIWMPHSKLIPVNPANLNPTFVEFSMIGDILA